jgi:hypothetical protein
MRSTSSYALAQLLRSERNEAESCVVGTDRAVRGIDVQGRITEAQLPDAERCMPGITRFYKAMATKPATFLDLLWAFQGRAQPCKSSRKRSR